jgi:hypothetical protein
VSRHDNETTPPEPSPPPERSPAPAKRLPARVERALASARAAAKADHERKGGRWLAALPVSAGILLLTLMMPRASAPEAIPVPRVDARVIREIERADDARAAAAEAERLPTYVLAVGSAFRALNALDARAGDEVEKIDARRRLEGTLRALPATASLDAELLSLRALQVRRFVDAVARWEATGEKTEDLVELGGNFVQRTEDAGWVVHRHVLFDETQRRVAFKMVWNTLLSVESRAGFTLTLDEQRALHAFYLGHPRPPEANRLSLAQERADAKTPEACGRVNLEHQRQAELWRADKIKKLGAIDPTYPTAYALGVAYYRAGRYDLSADAFTQFIDTHPDGAYSLRAKNHLKAALTATGPF